MSTPMVSVTAAAPLCCAVRPRCRPPCRSGSEGPALRRRRPMLPRRRHRAPARRAPRDAAVGAGTVAFPASSTGGAAAGASGVRRPGGDRPDVPLRRRLRIMPGAGGIAPHVVVAGRGRALGWPGHSSVLAAGAGGSGGRLGGRLGGARRGGPPGRTRAAGRPRPAARSPAPVASRSANSGLGSRIAAMPRQTGHTQHSAEPVAKAPGPGGVRAGTVTEATGQHPAERADAPPAEPRRPATPPPAPWRPAAPPRPGPNPDPFRPSSAPLPCHRTRHSAAPVLRPAA